MRDRRLDDLRHQLQAVEEAIRQLKTLQRIEADPTGIMGFGKLQVLPVAVARSNSCAKRRPKALAKVLYFPAARRAEEIPSGVASGGTGQA